MAHGEEDWAFTAHGYAYNTGKRHRLPYQVIQFRESIASQLSVRKSTELDTTVSKLDFSNEELDLTVHINYLALVVGECLLTNASDALSKREGKKQLLKNFDEFDRKKHSCLETTDTALIVARLKRGQLNLYQLTNKRDGLCDIQKLGRMKLSTGKSLAWYREFVTGSRITDSKKQEAQIRQKVKECVEDYVSDREAKRISNPPSLEPLIDPEVALRAQIEFAMKSFAETRSVEMLERIVEITRDALGWPEEGCDPSVEIHMQHIRLLGTGNMTFNTARRFINAYKKLWPDAVTSNTENIITPSAIMELDAGLSQGALSDVLPTPLAIPDALYRLFVIQFCEKASVLNLNNNPSLLSSTVSRAYQLTQAGMGCPFPKPDSAAPVGGDPSVEILSAIVPSFNRLIRFCNDELERIGAEKHIDTHLEPVDPNRTRLHFQSLAESVDFDITYRGFEEIWDLHFSHVREAIRNVRRKLRKGVQMIQGILQDLTGDEDTLMSDAHSHNDSATN